MLKNNSVPIYLISLKQDSARREALARRFPNFYKDFIHIKAVDGRLVSSKEYYDKAVPFMAVHGRLITPSELGCTLSHITALEAFLRTRNSFAFIVEDDIEGSDKDIGDILDCLEGLTSKALLFCGCQDGLMNKYKYGYKWGGGLLRVPSSNFGNFSRTAAYAISRSVAQSILDFHRDRYLTVADFWFELLDKDCVDVFYMAGLKHPILLKESNLEGERSVYNKNLFEKIFSKHMPGLITRRLVQEAKYFYYKAKGAVSIGAL